MSHAEKHQVECAGDDWSGEKEREKNQNQKHKES
jgi:hypothetical protein